MLFRSHVSIAKRVEGVISPLAESREFRVLVEGTNRLDSAQLKTLLTFQRQVARLDRAVSGALNAANELNTRLGQLLRAADSTPGVEPKWQAAVRDLEKHNRGILRALRGDNTLRARNENTPTSISERVGYIVDSQRFSLASPTKTQQESYRIASDEFTQELAKLRKLIEVDLRAVEKALDAAGAPWTSGRLLDWKDK